MITEGIVIGKSSLNGSYNANDLYISVRLPIFETAGNPNKAIFQCSLLTHKGLNTAYQDGDMVWVAFENNVINKPVIIGLINKGIEENAETIDLIAQSITITGKAYLPADTTIGDIKLSDIVNNAVEIEILKDQLKNLTIVAANPEGEASETLRTIQIGNIIYSLPSGGGGETDEDTFIFKDNLETMYTIGKYNGTLANPVTIPTKDKTFRQAWNEIFKKEENPVTTQPSVTFNLTNTAEQEVGTTVIPRWTATFNEGSYSYDESTGVELTEWTIRCGLDEEAHTATGTFGAKTVGNTAIRYTAQAQHTQGNIPHTNLGNEYPAGQINAGTKSAYKEVAKGYRKLFYGYSSITDVSDLTSTIIRSLANSKKNGAGALSTLAEDTTAASIIVACPANTRTLTKVEMPSSSMADVTSSFIKQTTTVNVEGANGFEAVAYDIWIYSPATMAGTYLITLG